MTVEDNSQAEIDATIAGQKFRAKGYRLMDLVCLGAFLLNGLVAWVLWVHSAEAKDTSKAVASELKDANREVANALKESNKEVAKVLNELAQAMREQNCLAQFATPAERAKNAELCKRISR